MQDRLQLHGPHQGIGLCAFPLVRQLPHLIRYNAGGAEGRAFIKPKAIIAQEIIRNEPWADGHVLTIEGRPKGGVVETQVALFNSIPYQIPLCRDYTVEWFAKGHHFNAGDRTVSELRVEVTGDGFDPATLF